MHPITAPTIGGVLRLESMSVTDLAEVTTIEKQIYPHPWTHGNFLDSLQSNYQGRVLRDSEGSMLGYFLMMLSVEEAHLLNLSVRGDLHGRGLGRYLLSEIARLAHSSLMSSILLEVRPSNPRALAIYERYGFIRIGRRNHYYPATDGQREDAIVMRLVL